MNLAQVISIFGGGPGSGCHGDNCGRPSSLDPGVSKQMRDLGYVEEVGKYSAKLYHASDDGKLNTHTVRGTFFSDDKDAIKQFGSQVTQHNVSADNAIRFTSAHSMFRYLLGEEGAKEWQDAGYKRIPGTSMSEQRDKRDPEYIEKLKALETKAAQAARAQGYDLVIAPFTRSADQMWLLDRSRIHAGRIFAGGPGSGCTGPNCGRKSLGWKDREITYPDKTNDIFRDAVHDYVTGTLGIDVSSDQVSKAFINHEREFPISKAVDTQGGAYDKMQVANYINAIKEGKPFEAITLAHVAGKSYVVDGHHRLEAAQHLGLTTIPASVVDIDDTYDDEDIHAGGPGSGCNGPNCGRPEGAGPKLSPRAQRAIASFVPLTADKLRVSKENEFMLANKLGGEAVVNNRPFDVIIQHRRIGIEVKTLIGKDVNDKITVHPSSRLRKEQYAKQNGIKKTFTIALDHRSCETSAPCKPIVYVKEGIGAYRLSAMQRVSLSSLRKVVLG